jgi:hypothetical protein
MEVKKQPKADFYIPIISFLESSTNLTELRKKLSISKQDLNYYLRILKKKNLIIQKGRGWYEPVKGVKTSTKYENLLVKDSSRGHAYVWSIKLPSTPEGWDRRIEILKEKGVHFKIVGAKLDVPRIKVLGRKVWLCKDHLRVFDKKDNSYYGKTAKEARKYALNEILLIVGALERKLGVSIRPKDIFLKKEHYALIKNDLAIEHNRKGEILHVSDEEGEWLLIDDSLGKGGELETIGKGAYKNNIPLQSWWNDHKSHNFKVTPTFLLTSINQVTQNQMMFNKNFETHVSAIKQLSSAIEELTKKVKELSLERNK